MRALLDEYDDRIMVGEICLSNEQLMTYYGQAYDECHLPFNFQLILTPWEAEAVHKAMDAYEKSLREKGWPNWVLGNHDEQWDASPNAGFAETAVQTWLPFAHDYAQVNVATQSDDPDSMLLLSDAGRVAGVRTSAHGGRLHVR